MRAETARVASPMAPTAAARTRALLADYWVLTKPEVNFLVVAAALAGYYLGERGAIDWLRLGHTLVGTGLVAGGTATLNQLLEQDVDARMRRTAQRPLPARRLTPTGAAIFGVLLAMVGGLELAIAVNVLSSALALLTLVSYLFAYTPLKRRTSLCTAIGALPGAMPVLIGWTAAGQALDLSALVLYAILFFWQFPHFLAIAWLYREDYARGGVVMLPRGDTTGRRTAAEIVLCSAAMVVATLLPTWTRLTGSVYLLGAALLGLGFFVFVLRFAAARAVSSARALLHATVIYLPLLYGLMMVAKLPR